MRALRLPADGTAAQMVDVAYDPAKADYRPTAKLIGADYIEVVRTPLEGLVMLVDEEGALSENRVLNQLASDVFYPGRIWGDALLFTETNTPEGRDITDLSDTHRVLALSLLAFNARYGAGVRS